MEKRLQSPSEELKVIRTNKDPSSSKWVDKRRLMLQTLQKDHRANDANELCLDLVFSDKSRMMHSFQGALANKVLFRWVYNLYCWTGVFCVWVSYDSAVFSRNASTETFMLVLSPVSGSTSEREIKIKGHRVWIEAAHHASCIGFIGYIVDWIQKYKVDCVVVKVKLCVGSE